MPQKSKKAGYGLLQQIFRRLMLVLSVATYPFVLPFYSQLDRWLATLVNEPTAALIALFFLLLAPILFAMLIVLVVESYLSLFRTQRPTPKIVTPNPIQLPRSTTPVLDVRILKRSIAKLSPTGFEHWVLQVLTFIGWQQVEMCGGAADRGVDLRGVYQRESCIVQCKHYRSRNVTPKEVRELIGTLHVQRVQRAFFVTSSAFSSQCYQEIVGQPVELWDVDTLIHHIRETFAKEPSMPIPSFLANYCY